MDRQYAICDALLFPSLLETWGLPLTEAKARGIPILAADLPYARETVGTCSAVRFFDPHNPQGLAELLIELSLGRSQFEAVQRSEPEEPFADGWRALLKILLVDDAASTSGQAGRP
jgi:glycosyltransferase involved in cell wall biosynthesis